MPARLRDRFCPVIFAQLRCGRLGRQFHYSGLNANNLPTMQQTHFFQRVGELLAAVQADLVAVGTQREWTRQVVVVATEENFVEKAVNGLKDRHALFAGCGATICR